jgi:D-3-phosphoglycerate dehydrogenase / 2-oxoglutarate reductase
MIIFNAEPAGYSEEASAVLRSLGHLIAFESSRAELIERVHEADVLIVRLNHQVDEEVLSHASRLKVIVSATTGLNHIDLAAAAARGVAVLSLKGERDFLNVVTSTAEHAWELLLSLIRHVPAAVQNVLAGNWTRDSFRGRQLSGLTLGLVGFGRLGSMVADYAHAFRMRVLATDIADVPMPSGVERVSLDQLLVRSDVVSLHADMRPSNLHMLSTCEFERMKPGALLVNTARGELIDEVALLSALTSGRLGGAALDVLDREAARDDAWLDEHPLHQFARKSDRLLITPHIGGATHDAMLLAEVFMARKLAEFLRGVV